MYHESMTSARPLAENVREYVRRHALVRPGDRVGLAVSGGADSVALLRLLLELRGELGVVLCVLHFHHGIRGPEADADQQFVARLAAAHGLEFHVEAGDSPAHVASHGLSLEAAARDLRYTWFRHLLRRRVVDRVATAHTLDDQAETVLMRILRGAGTKGVAGIYPQLACQPAPGAAVEHAGEVARFHSSIIRPLLDVRWSRLRDYLRDCGQDWREDLSNRDRRHLRNRIRLELLPLLEGSYNPQVADVLAHHAELARAEEAYWREQVARTLPHIVPAINEREAEAALLPEALLAQPLALQRRLVRAAAEAAGLRLAFREVEQVRHLASGPAGATRTLPQGWMAVRGPRDLRLVRPALADAATDYEYRLPVPGEVRVAEIGSVIRATLAPPTGGGAEYNALPPHAQLPELVVRNWRAGDRFRPAHTRSPKKVKTLLQQRRVAAADRRQWPVVLCGGTIVWMRGFPATEPASAARLRIEEVRTRPAASSTNPETTRSL